MSTEDSSLKSTIELLHIIISASSKATTTSEFIQFSLDEICTFTGWPVGHCYLLSETDRSVLVPTNHWHLNEPSERFAKFKDVTMITPLSPGLGLPGRVFDSGKATWVVDANFDPNFPRNKIAKNLGIKAGFGMPILVEGKVVGVLEFFYEQALEPDESLLKLIDSITCQLGQLFHKQQMKESLNIRSREFAEMKQMEMILFAQNKILELVATGKPLYEVLSSLITSIEALCPGMLGSILFLDPSGKHLHKVCAPSLPSAYNNAIEGGAIGPTAGSCGTAAYFGKRVIVEDIEKDPLWKDYATFALQNGLRACWSQPILISDGRVVGTFAMYYKETRHPSEQELRILETAAHVAAVAVERDTMEQNWKATLLDLEKSNTELEQFVYIASHDLQEPLRVVAMNLQYLERLTKNKLSSDELKFIQFSVQSGVRMREMIQSLLLYTSIWRDNLQVKKINLNEMVQRALESLQVSVSQSGAKIQVGTLPSLAVDPILIVQLFQNLINNAIKYRSERVPEIDISAKETEKEWVISVRDNGIGIDPAYAEKIFVVFQRLHSDREKYPGTGIGLSICKKILERHGGRIWVESTLRKGATFFFALPK